MIAETLPDGDTILAAYDDINQRARCVFEDEDELRLMEPFKAYLPEVVFIRQSRRFKMTSHYDYFEWCSANIGKPLVDRGQPTIKTLPDGRRLHTREYLFNPDGRWVLLRHTPLFRTTADAMWFRMMWW